MFGIQELSIDFLTGSPVLTTLSLLVMIGLGIYLYRRTNPPLPARWLFGLGALRLIAVLALFLALLEPVVSFTREYVRPRRVAVMIDRSLSMNKTEDGKTRQVRVDSLLSGTAFESLQEAVEVTPLAFAGNLAGAAGTVDGSRTALGDALYELDQRQIAKPYDQWLLLSDGNSNSGRQVQETVRNLHTPVITIDMSSGAGAFDVVLDDIEFNPVMFAGRQSEIKARLNWRNAAGRTVAVRLLDSARVIESIPLTITQEGGMGDVSLMYTPTEPGQKLLKISAQPLAGEESADNNERTISVKVLKSRLAVLLAVKRPDYEVGFLRRFLDRSDKYDVDMIVIGSKAGNLAGRFPIDQTELNRYDLVILYDPDPVDLAGREQIIRSYLQERGGAMWVLMGPEFAARGPVNWFNELLPFYPSSVVPMQYVQFRAEPQESQLFHPTIRLADNQSGVREVWASLPPFRMLVWCDRVHADGVVLATTSIRRREGAAPALGYRRHGPGKLLAGSVLPFWPWGFVNLGFGEDDSRYGAFIEGVTGWLTVRDDFEPIRVQPEKEVFTRGEDITFNGFAYDLGYRPIPNASGTVRLQGGPSDDAFETDLIGAGDGGFRAVFENLTPGRYDYTAAVEQDGRVLKTDQGSILVEAFSLEEFDQSGDPAALAALARRTGGSSFSYREFDRALDMIDRTDLAVSTTEEFSFWNKLWLLLVLIGALSLEWLLRKINQLV